MITLALFNNKGGVGKTTLTYHLAHMYQRLGVRVLAVDLDPQANLTSAFLNEDDLATLWGEAESPAWREHQQRLPGVTPDKVSDQVGTVAQSVHPIMEGLGDIAHFTPIEIMPGLSLVPGDLELSAFEEKLSDAWPRSFPGNDLAAIRTTTAFHRIIREAADSTGAQLVLIDVGPNLGAINRASLLAADSVLMPLAADLFSLRGLRNLGPTLRDWRTTWQETIRDKIPQKIPSPAGTMEPLGYVIMQPTMRLDRPVQAYRRWLERIPSVFETAVLGESAPTAVSQAKSFEIATLKNYQSLMPLAHDARKPMFDLRSADGAIGSMQSYVQRCYLDFKKLAVEVAGRLDKLEVTEPINLR
ncbi:ParA family protein [Actinosynnema sp. NPDC002837]